MTKVPSPVARRTLAAPSTLTTAAIGGTIDVHGAAADATRLYAVKAVERNASKKTQAGRDASE